MIEFAFIGAGHGRYWLVIEKGGGTSVCLEEPGFDINLVVTTDVTAFYQGRRA